MITLRRFGAEPGQLPVEVDRYRLVISPLCPWCRRVAIARRLVGLQDAIALTESVGQSEDGFVFETPGYTFDVDLRVRTARELYRRHDEWNIGEPTTVPVVVDRDGTIVAGESNDLMIDFLTAWKPEQTIPRDLYPVAEREHLDAIDRIIDTKIAPNVSRALSYDMQERIEALSQLIPALDWAEERLKDDGFISCNEPRESDIRMFTHLSVLWGITASQTDIDCARAMARGTIHDDEPCQVYLLHEDKNITDQCDGSVDRHKASTPSHTADNQAEGANACVIVNMADHAPDTDEQPSACSVNWDTDDASDTDDTHERSAVDTNPEVLTYWPSVWDWWRILAGAPGWVSPSEREALDIPPSSQLMKQ